MNKLMSEKEDKEHLYALSLLAKRNKLDDKKAVYNYVLENAAVNV